MLGPGRQHFDAFFIRTPLQNIDIDLPHAPAFHFQSCRLVKVNGAGADQSGTVIIDHIFLGRIHDLESSSEREARPVGRGAPNSTTGKTLANGVVSSTATTLVDTVRRRAHVYAVRFRSVASYRWLGCATCEKGTDETSES